MFSLGEMLFLAVLALVIVGPRQLPELARTIGRFVNEMKRASSSITDEFRVNNIAKNITTPPPAAKPVAPAVKTETDSKNES